jgi:very-short-patch-repair endonuclease
MWLTRPDLWQRLKPVARQMRHESTDAERCLWVHLRGKQLKGFKFRRQHAFERFIIDFYCAEAKLVIEVDGPTHDYSQQEDAIRQEFIESLGFCILRLTNEQVLNHCQDVLRAIDKSLQRSPLPASGEGVGVGS